MRRLVVVVVVLSTFALVGATSAQARTFPTSSSFGFLEGSPDAFLGQVSSPKSACEAGRIVKVYRQRRGRDRLVGSDRASSTGQWIVERADVRRARYYAKTGRKRIGRNKDCRPWRSSTLRLGGDH